MKKIISDEINKQINEELFSSYLYLSMAAWAKQNGYAGLSNWMIAQAKEEIDHAMGFYNFLIERGGTVTLLEIKKPKSTFASYTEIFRSALEHEKYITSKINSLFELSRKHKDYAFESFIKWYIDEQVEEEANAQDVLDKLKLVGDKGAGLFQIDSLLEKRVYTETSPIKD